MRLAEATGHASVDAMLACLRPKELDEWIARDIIEPIGNRGVCIVLTRIGLLMSAWMGANLKECDFMPWLTEQPEAKTLTPAQSRTAMMAEIRRAAGAV